MGEANNDDIMVLIVDCWWCGCGDRWWVCIFSVSINPYFHKGMFVL